MAILDTIDSKLRVEPLTENAIALIRFPEENVRALLTSSLKCPVCRGPIHSCCRSCRCGGLLGCWFFRDSRTVFHSFITSLFRLCSNFLLGRKNLSFGFFGLLFIIGLGHFSEQLLSLTTALIDLPLLSFLLLLYLLKSLSFHLFFLCLLFGFLPGALFLKLSPLIFRQVSFLNLLLLRDYGLELGEAAGLGPLNLLNLLALSVGFLRSSCFFVILFLLVVLSRSYLFSFFLLRRLICSSYIIRCISRLLLISSIGCGFSSVRCFPRHNCCVGSFPWCCLCSVGGLTRPRFSCLIRSGLRLYYGCS